MFTIQPKNPEKLEALRRIRNPRVAEIVIIHWREKGIARPIAYAPCDYLNWPNYQGLAEQLGEIPLEPKIRAESAEWFQQLFFTGDISDDEVTIEFIDRDRVIQNKAKKAKGSAVEILYYFPEVDWLVAEWWGQLRSPKGMGGKSIKLTAATGLRSPKLQLPKTLLGAVGCQAFYPPETALTREQIAVNPCRVDRHLPNSTFGNLDAQGNYFPTCPHTIEGCLERTEAPGATVPLSYFGLDARKGVTLVGQSKGSPVRASARGNGTNLDQAVPWVFGEYLMREVPVIQILPEVNTNTKDQAALRVLPIIGHGPLGEVGECRVNNVIVKPQDQQIRLGNYRQPVNGFFTGVADVTPLSFNLLANAYLVIIGGPWNAQTADQTKVQIMIKRGYTQTRVLNAEGESSYVESNNRLWVNLTAYTDFVRGHGYSIQRFNRDSLLYSAEWCDRNVQALTAKKEIITTRRSEFNGAFYGRQASQEFRDAFLYGGLTYPFLHEGELYVLPLETADLTEVPVLEDHHFMVDETGDIDLYWDMKDDDELAYSVRLNIEDREADFQDRPLTFKNLQAIFEEGQNLGEPIVREPREVLKALGVTKYGQGVRLGWRFLHFGQFDTGGISNNATVHGKMPWVWVKKHALHLFKVVAIPSDKVSDSGFQYFRVMSMRRSAGLVYDITFQAYNHELYQLLDQDELTPGLIKESDGTEPATTVTIGTLPRAVRFVNAGITPNADGLCFYVEEVSNE